MTWDKWLSATSDLRPILPSPYISIHNFYSIPIQAIFANSYSQETVLTCQHHCVSTPDILVWEIAFSKVLERHSKFDAKFEGPLRVNETLHDKKLKVLDLRTHEETSIHVNLKKVVRGLYLFDSHHLPTFTHRHDSARSVVSDTHTVSAQ